MKLSILSRNSPLVRTCDLLSLTHPSGLRHLKKRDIIHRDLKPENLLLHRSSEYPPRHQEFDYVVKLTDFGLARLLEGPFDLAQTYAGTKYDHALRVVLR